MYLVKKNCTIQNADGKILKHAGKVNENSRSAGIFTNNFISIFVGYEEDPDNPGVSTLDRINEFLSGDLSSLCWEYDVVDVRNNDEFISHGTEYFNGYSTNASVTRYFHELTQSYNYKITLKCSDEEYEKALQDHNDIMDLYAAIATNYESLLEAE